MKKFRSFQDLVLFAWNTSMVAFAFFSIHQAQVAKNGVKALDLTLDFDEMAVLDENRKYLASTLEVSACIYDTFMEIESTVE